MYECLMHTLRAYFGSGVLRTSLFISVILVSLFLVASVAPSFRVIVEKMKQKNGFLCFIAELMTGIFKLAVILIILRLLIVALNYQADVFAREHGRITAKNRSAILMKWGHPHEQRELYVTHKRKRIWVTRQLLIKTDSKASKLFSDSFWKDQKTPIRPVNGQIPSVLSENEELRWVDVPQRSILSGDVTINLTNNPRRLGNANYAGYDDIWNLKYVIKNKSKWDTAAVLFFKLPASTGLFDKMQIKIDGVDMLENSKTESDGVSLAVSMKPGEKKIVEIDFHSRGLEYLRYIPARMSRSAHYRVAIQINGVSPNELDYPIGSMPPLEKLSDLSGDSYTLNWQLDNALTSYDIGIKLPEAKQPEFHFSRLLREAPVGVILLLFALLLPPLVLKEKVRLDAILLIAVLYCLHYTFMGRLADLMSGFINPFIISTLVLVAIVFIFRFSIKGSSRFLQYQDCTFFLIMGLFYPLAVISDHNPFWMQIFYIAFITYFCFLIAVKIITKQRIGKEG